MTWGNDEFPTYYKLLARSLARSFGDERANERAKSNYVYQISILRRADLTRVGPNPKMGHR